MLNDKEELCECLFCDCVFPCEEAMEIAKDPASYTFPNEPQPKREGTKRYTETRVFSDPIPVAIKRAAVSEEPKKTEKNPYEVTPDDVKAPRKIFWGIIGGAAILVILIVAIAWPLYIVREANEKKVNDRLSEVFTEFSVNTGEADGYNIGFSLLGQENNTLAVTTDEDVSAEEIVTTFKNFAKLRAEVYGISQDNFAAYYGSVHLTVYAKNGGFELDVETEADLVSANVTDLT